MESKERRPDDLPRAPGPSVADILCTDAIPPPSPLLEQAPPTAMGEADIDCRRYTSRAFFEQEMEQLWPRCWQWACREEHIPEPGDNYVYDVGRWSVIVARTETGDIRAYMNSCTHRGTRILGHTGTGYSQGFTCPFHGWSWELDGRQRELPARWDFPGVCNGSHDLRPVQCETWGGFVFINMDPGAGPLADSMDVLPEHFAHFPMEQREVVVHVRKTLPANWKAAQEAFLEAYHNFETHNSPNGANAQYDIFGKYVSRFIHTVGDYSPESLADYPGTRWRDPPLDENQKLQSLGFGQPDATVPEGSTARAVAAEGLRQKLGAETGVDLTGVSDSLMLDSIEYHLFPNMFFFPGIAIALAYRFRPNGEDTDSCLFDLMLLKPLPEGARPAEPPEPRILSVEQSYTEVAELQWLGPVYDEDTGNLQMQQAGLKTSAKRGITLGNYQEARIRRIHQTLDEFLEAKGEI